jgi:hypothetical protein
MSDMTSAEGGEVGTPPEQVPAPPPPPSPVPYSAGEWGPPGAVRGPVFVILIGIVTLGIYWIYWWYKVFQEMKDHTKTGLGGGPALAIVLVGVVLCGGLLSYVLAFILPTEIGNMYRRLGEKEPVKGVTGLWFILPIIGQIIWLVKVQNAMNRRWEELGVTKT